MQDCTIIVRYGPSVDRRISVDYGRLWINYVGTHRETLGIPRVGMLGGGILVYDDQLMINSVQTYCCAHWIVVGYDGSVNNDYFTVFHGGSTSCALLA